MTFETYGYRKSIVDLQACYRYSRDNVLQVLTSQYRYVGLATIARLQGNRYPHNTSHRTSQQNYYLGWLAECAVTFQYRKR